MFHLHHHQVFSIVELHLYRSIILRRLYIRIYRSNPIIKIQVCNTVWRFQFAMQEIQGCNTVWRFQFIMQDIVVAGQGKQDVIQNHLDMDYLHVDMAI